MVSSVSNLAQQEMPNYYVGKKSFIIKEYIYFIGLLLLTLDARGQNALIPKLVYLAS